MHKKSRFIRNMLKPFRNEIPNINLPEPRFWLWCINILSLGLYDKILQAIVSCFSSSGVGIDPSGMLFQLALKMAVCFRSGNNIFHCVQYSLPEWETHSNYDRKRFLIDSYLHSEKNSVFKVNHFLLIYSN